jgi:glycosyltransferase involved in cell wall biosynthesis
VHVCLSCIEFFGRGIQGGFGRATRFLGRELVRRGVQVSVVVPRRGQLQEGLVDGMRVRGFDGFRPWTAVPAYRACGADIYHSQDTSLGTALARLAMPRAKHMVTFRDPMDRADWRLEAAMSGKNRLAYFTYRTFIDNPWVDHAVRRADACYCAARFLIPKVVRKYGFTRPPGFLPTPVDIPATVAKASRPTVVFLSRWDPRKRPERFIELARRLPAVDFIAVGASSDPVRDAWLRRQAAAVSNLQAPGIIDQFATDQLSRVLASSWVLVNISPREGLPNAFLEAAAHGCALLSLTDPDGFTSRFGAVAEETTLEERLAWLLAEDRWRERGAAGREFVAEVFATSRSLDEHVAAYGRLLA